MLVLIVEDEIRIRQGIAEMLSDEGYDVLEAGSLEEGFALIESETPPVILTDIRLPDGDGFSLLRYCRVQEVDTAVIVMTAFGGRDVAIEAITEGAYDYISKPIRFDELFARLKRLDEMQSLRGQVIRKAERKIEEGQMAVLGDSAPMRKVRALACRAADSDAPLLITGETGVGKGLLARLVHASGIRSSRPFIGINCATIPENLLESELFGFRKGAFTSADKNKSGLLEEVGEGTLFLDEIGDMPLTLQVKLLHVLDDGSFRPLGSTKDQKFKGRIIAATNVDLAVLIKAKTFRTDLFYRISVLCIEIPPLRKRPDDLLALAERLYVELAAQMGRKVQGLPLCVAEGVQHGQWPGNVRELRNYLERSLIFEEIAENGDSVDMSLSSAVGRFERAWIERVIDECGGNKAAAAERLGLGLSTLYRKLEP